MGSVFNAIYSVWNQIVYAVSNFRIFDILDILVMAFIIYKAIVFLRDSRAGQLFKGILILLVVYAIAGWWELVTLQWLLSKVVDAALIAAVVIFQPELRRILERVGRTKIGGTKLFDSSMSGLEKSIDDVSKAAGTMQEKRIGALIVFERTTLLGDIVDTGTVLDAESSVAMINNVFFPKSPLHDGAVIIREGRIYAAGCILPLTQREDLNMQLGTRHRAAIGMTENSDAVVLVVSEETGIISIVHNGQISRNYSAVSAAAELQSLLLSNEKKDKSFSFKELIEKIVPKKKDRKEDEE